MSDINDIIGIDFGTTNSKMAYMLLDMPVMIENAEGKKVIPSVVHFAESGEVIVGEFAKRSLVAYPSRTIASIKRQMGSGFRMKLGKFKYPPEYIAAHILGKLVKDAELRTGKKFRDAVISVPANYLDAQRQAIRDAGEIAGLNVVRMINEPTAAAIAYGYREDRERRVLVYDFGGGTFDVSILTIGGGFFDVDATCGEHKLGGDDIDERIIALAAKKLLEERGVDVKKDLGLYQVLREAAEEAKIRLSRVEATTIDLPFAGGADSFTMPLTRSELNMLISDLIEKTKGPIERALNDASLEIGDIDDIILVGGTTLIPAIQSFVGQFFGKEPIGGTDPYEAVALGAAIAGFESGRERSRIARNIEVSDVISSSLGVFTADGTISRILERNTKVPIARTKEFTNAGNFVKEVIIPVYQGEGLFPHENEFLGEFWVSVEPMPAGWNRIDVSFELGKEFGILDVTARDQDSGSTRGVKLQARGRLSRNEKNKWMKRMLGVACTRIKIANTATRDALNLHLHPNSTILDLKRELRARAIIRDGEAIFRGTIELLDEHRIGELDLREDDILEVKIKGAVRVGE